MKSPVSLLIAGGTGTGKSTLGAVLAHALGIQHVLGTDLLREVIRQHIPRVQDRFLHESSFKAWKLLEEDSPQLGHDECVRTGYVLHRREVVPGIRAVLERAHRECFPVVIEGIHVSPSCRPAGMNNLVYVCFSPMSDHEQMKRVSSRASVQPQRGHKGVSRDFRREMHLIAEVIYGEFRQFKYRHKLEIDPAQSVLMNVELIVKKFKSIWGGLVETKS